MKRDRLNEIKKWKDDIDLTGCEVSEHNFYTIHIEWLIEQAELVEELEQQNKRYREAIEKGINATRYTNPEVAYILNEALEESE